MVDFVVVGSGAAGGVMARELSQAGDFSVLVFEQGPRWAPPISSTTNSNIFS
jgi:choline dehydrogenase-like flavoprotein